MDIPGIKSIFCEDKFMTYKQMTKEINKIDEMVKFIYEIQKDKMAAKDVEIAHFCGEIANALYAYKNYLTYIKQYDSVDVNLK